MNFESYAIRSSVNAGDMVCRSAGRTAIRETSVLEKHFSDVQVITKHAFASALALPNSVKRQALLRILQIGPH